MMPSRYVHYADLRATDVLVGRGAFTDRYQGNVWFRSLVAERKSMHASTKLVAEKTSLVLEVREIIRHSGGRFLRRIDNVEAKHLGWIEGIHETTIWEPIDEEVALEKIKQAFRDVALMPRKDGNQRSTSSGPPQTSRGGPIGSKRQKTDSTAVAHQSLPIPSSIEFVNPGDPSDDRKMPPQNPAAGSTSHHYQDPYGIFTQERLLELVRQYQASLDDSTPRDDRASSQSTNHTSAPAPAVPPEPRPSVQAPIPSTTLAQHAMQTEALQRQWNLLAGISVAASSRRGDPNTVAWRDILALYEMKLPRIHRYEEPPLTRDNLQALLLISNLAMVERDFAALYRLRLVLLQVKQLPSGQVQLSPDDIDSLQDTIQSLASLT